MLLEEEYNNEEEKEEFEELELLNGENHLPKEIVDDFNKHINIINKFSQLINEENEIIPESFAKEFKKNNKIIKEFASILNSEDINQEEIIKALEEQTEAMKDFVSMMNEEGLISEYESAVMCLDTEIKCFSLDYNIETEFLDIPSGVDFSNLDIPEEIKPYIEKGEYQSVYAFNIPTDLKPYFEEYIKIVEVSGYFKLKENGYTVKLTYSYEDEPSKIYIADIIEPESREITNKFSKEIQEKLKDNPYIDYDFIVNQNEDLEE